MQLLLPVLATLGVALTTASPHRLPYHLNVTREDLLCAIQPITVYGHDQLPNQPKVEDVTSTEPSTNGPEHEKRAINEQHDALIGGLRSCGSYEREALGNIMKIAEEGGHTYGTAQQLRRLIISPDVPGGCKDHLVEKWNDLQIGEDIGDIFKARSVEGETDQPNSLTRRIDGCSWYEEQALESIMWEADQEGVIYDKPQKLRKLIFSPEVPARCKPALEERWNLLRNGEDIGPLHEERSIHGQAKQPNALTDVTAQGCIDQEREVLDLIMEEAGVGGASYDKRDKLRRLIIDPRLPKRCRDWELERWDILEAGGYVGPVPAEDKLFMGHHHPTPEWSVDEQHEQRSTELETESEGPPEFDMKDLRPLKVPDQNPDWLKEKLKNWNGSEPSSEEFWNSDKPAPPSTSTDKLTKRLHPLIAGEHCDKNRQRVFEEVRERQYPDYRKWYILRLMIVDPELGDTCLEVLLDKWDEMKRGEDLSDFWYHLENPNDSTNHDHDSVSKDKSSEAAKRTTNPGFSLMPAGKHCHTLKYQLYDKVKERESDHSMRHMLRMMIVAPEMGDPCREELLDKWDALQRGEDISDWWEDLETGW